MTKRADQRFERQEDDFYPTPEKAVFALLPFLDHRTMFYEPCAGDGSLAQVLIDRGHNCMGMSDIAPRANFVKQLDARMLPRQELSGARMIITNPPYERAVMHELMEYLPKLVPTWMLLEADWLFTQQARNFWPHIDLILAIGRVRWMQGSKHDGFDNYAWCRFQALPVPGGARFWGR